MDSNRKSVFFPALFPDFNVRLCEAGTIDWAHRAGSNLQNPDVILIHVGTNDLDSGMPAKDCASKLVDLAAELQQTYPTATIFISHLLSRQYHLPQEHNTATPI